MEGRHEFDSAGGFRAKSTLRRRLKESSLPRATRTRQGRRGRLRCHRLLREGVASPAALSTTTATSRGSASRVRIRFGAARSLHIGSPRRAAQGGDMAVCIRGIWRRSRARVFAGASELRLLHGSSIFVSAFKIFECKLWAIASCQIAVVLKSTGNSSSGSDLSRKLRSLEAGLCPGAQLL